MNRMDSMLSRGLGTFKAVKARLSGLVGIFKTLSEQHGEVTALLERAKTSDARFTELWPEIRRELLSHERAEMRELYPILRLHARTVALADHHDAEASQLEHLITQIDGLAVGTVARRDLFHTLVDTVRHHAKKEETEIFGVAQEAIGKELALELDKSFRATKKSIADAT